MLAENKCQDCAKVIPIRRCAVLFRKLEKQHTHCLACEVKRGEAQWRALMSDEDPNGHLTKDYIEHVQARADKHTFEQQYLGEWPKADPGDARCNFCDGKMPCYCKKPNCQCIEYFTGNEHNGMKETAIDPCETCMTQYERDTEGRNSYEP